MRYYRDFPDMHTPAALAKLAGMTVAEYLDTTHLRDTGEDNESIAEREDRLGRKLTREEARERIAMGWRKGWTKDHTDNVLDAMGY